MNKLYTVNVYHKNKATLKKHFGHKPNANVNVNANSVNEPKTVFGHCLTLAQQLDNQAIKDLKERLEPLGFRIHLSTARAFEITILDKADRNYTARMKYYEFADDVDQALLQLKSKMIGLRYLYISSVTSHDAATNITTSYQNLPFTLSDVK